MELKAYVQDLPQTYGCYLYVNDRNDVIYVGKAKNIKKRVQSYFSKSQSEKTMIMLNEAVKIEYITTNNELESLILEYNLINKYDPRYNVLLKDDSSYPYILLTKDTNPRLIVTREYKKELGEYYGPYADVKAAREVVNLLNRLYPIRKCKNLPNESCLYYHIKQCLGPCVNELASDVYDEYLNDIRHILKGKDRDIINNFTVKMYSASEELKFEEAHNFKKMIDYLKRTSEKQTINLKRELECDIINYSIYDNYVCVQILFVRNGSLIERQGDIFELVTDAQELVIQYIYQYYQKQLVPEQIIIPEELDQELLASVIYSSFYTPKIGDKKRLLDLAKNNAKMQLETHVKRIYNKDDKISQIKEGFLKILGLHKVYRIDAFDISHFSGVDTVGVMVVFKEFKNSYNDYRKYKVTKDQNNDVNSLKEVLYRRYYRMLMEDEEYPDLIVIDGGKPQFNAAVEIVEQLNLNIPVISLIKDDYHRTKAILSFEGEKEFSNREFKNFLTMIQDEVHRYAINYYRSLHNKKLSVSVLDDIKTVGPKTRILLLKEFQSVENIEKATLEELSKVVNKRTAINIYNYFKEEK